MKKYIEFGFELYLDNKLVGYELHSSFDALSIIFIMHRKVNDSKWTRVDKGGFIMHDKKLLFSCTAEAFKSEVVNNNNTNRTDEK